MEEWKVIEDYPDYMISSKAKIKSLERYVYGGQGKDNLKKEKILKPSNNGNGYMKVMLYNEYGYKQKYIHRLLGEYFLPNPDHLPQINHINGIKNDNRIENIEWVTISGNSQHAVKNNLIKGGEDSPSSKLTEKEVLEIKHLLINTSLTQEKISDRYNISRGCVYKIKHGMIWKHLNM